MAKLVDVIAQAIADSDAHTLGSCADQLRCDFGMTYDRIYEFFNRQRPLTRERYETLMHEADGDYTSD